MLHEHNILARLQDGWKNVGEGFSPEDPKHILKVRDRILAVIGEACRSWTTPLVVEIDRDSEAGKIMLNDMIAQGINAVVFPRDDCSTRNIPDPKWREIAVQERLNCWVAEWNARIVVSSSGDLAVRF
jgi:hypothetical protein